MMYKTDILLGGCYSLIQKLSETNNVIAMYQNDGTSKFNPLSLSHGYPGLIMLFAEMDRLQPGERWDHVTHAYIKQLKVILEQTGINNDPSLYNGLSGINFSIILASNNGKRYSSIIKKLEASLYDFGTEYLYKIKEINKQLKYGTPEYGYDLITGLTGIGAYILKSKNSNLIGLLENILSFFIELSLNGVSNEKGVCSFLSSPEAFIIEEDKKNYPYGCLNLGMSHGISGPLALLSLSYIQGVRLDNQLDSIITLASEFTNTLSVDKNGYFVKRMVDTKGLTNNFKTGNNERYDAWCYGGFGVAGALALAYEATRDSGIKETALKVIGGLLKSPVKEWNIHSPMICHGYSGNLQVINRLLDSV